MQIKEFLDLENLWPSVRNTLRMILETGNSFPFRTYYTFVSECALKANAQKIYELGAGSAPIAHHLGKNKKAEAVVVIPCDLHPDLSRYQKMKMDYKNIDPLFQSVDFLDLGRLELDGSVLVLSGTFHHLSVLNRKKWLHSIVLKKCCVIIAEPLRKNLASFLFVPFSLVPALLTPIIHCWEAQRWHYVIWCWVLPIAPLLFIWDGFISVTRMWNKCEWEKILEETQIKSEKIRISEGPFTQIVQLDLRD